MHKLQRFGGAQFSLRQLRCEFGLERTNDQHIDRKHRGHQQARKQGAYEQVSNGDSQLIAEDDEHDAWRDDLTERS